MKLNWGILTAGGISRAFASSLNTSKTGTLVATGARDLNRATDFANEFGGVGYGSYEEVLADSRVDVVYIATPHHLHAEWTMKAAQAGKGVLCEKPFTLNLNEAKEALRAVEKANVFFMEAFMYRCSPQTRKLIEVLDSGVLGQIVAIDAEFSYGSSRDRVNFRTNKDLGGGGLMDVGCYCTSLAAMVVGASPIEVKYSANLNDGYDSYGSGVLKFPGGEIATVTCGVHLAMDNQAVIYGTNGTIRITDPWKSDRDSSLILSLNGQSEQIYRLGCSTDELYAHEADAVGEFFAQGECPWMTRADTLLNMQILDQLRASCGLIFPSDQ